jgi:hypothetical protein
VALRKRTATFALALSLVIVGAAALGATAADAAPGTLTIAPTGYNDQYSLTVSGSYSTYFPYGVDIVYRLWGEDEWFDDLLFTPPGATYQGYWMHSYERQFTVAGSTLNEDWGWDEIYVDVRLYDHRTGKLVQTIETNRLYGTWS